MIIYVSYRFILQYMKIKEYREHFLLQFDKRILFKYFFSIIIVVLWIDQVKIQRKN